MMRRRGRVLRNLSILLPLLLILFLHVREMGFRHELQPMLQTFQLGDGWGYKVMLNKRMIIYQPTIPAIDSLKPFPTERSAQRIGSIVVERIKKNQNFSITREDVIHSLSDQVKIVFDTRKGSPVMVSLFIFITCMSYNHIQPNHLIPPLYEATDYIWPYDQSDSKNRS